MNVFRTSPRGTAGTACSIREPARIGAAEPPSRAIRTPSNSRIVRRKIELFGDELGAVSYDFWHHVDFPRVYRRYLFRYHSIARASVPLMEEAERSCSLPRHRDDPALRGFAEYLRKHIPEETGHDLWILDDADAVGLDRNDLLTELPIEAVTQVVGVQYYWIKHYNPIALIGHIATLEGNPPTTEFVKQVAARSGLSLDCFSSHLYHARIDPQHRKDLDEVLDALPLTEEHLALIGLSSLRTIGLMTEIMRDIVDSTDPPPAQS